MAESQKAEEQASGIATDEGEFSSLLQKEFKPKTEQARSEVENAVRTLAQQALAKTHAHRRATSSSRSRR